MAWQAAKDGYRPRPVVPSKKATSALVARLDPERVSAFLTSSWHGEIIAAGAIPATRLAAWQGQF